MKIKAKRVATDFDSSVLDHESWSIADPGSIARYWSGEPAPAGRRVEIRLLWSDESLYVRFDAACTDPLNLNPEPILTAKKIGLWDFDVCEIFIAPNREKPRRYFEFEVSPTGEWIDLAIHQMPDRRETDWDFVSGMKAAALVADDRVSMSMAIPWTSLGSKPVGGDAWRGNLFRCVGKDPERGYLAWSPTLTQLPNFHVPERFGEIVFDD